VVKQGQWRKVPREQAHGRRRNGEDYLDSARSLLALAEPGANGNPIMSNALLAVIAYADALSIHFAGIQNADDHAAVVETAKLAMGDAADAGQLTRLQRLIRQKNQVQYDHRTATVEQARTFLEQAERFSRWAEESLARP
jgi:hypothetical protein